MDMSVSNEIDFKGKSNIKDTIKLKDILNIYY